MKKRFKRKPYIRYSNVYEEINSLLRVASGKTYLSVCSGFDNTLALLLNNLLTYNTAPRLHEGAYLIHECQALL